MKVAAPLLLLLYIVGRALKHLFPKAKAVRARPRETFYSSAGRRAQLCDRSGNLQIRYLLAMQAPLINHKGKMAIKLARLQCSTVRDPTYRAPS